MRNCDSRQGVQNCNLIYSSLRENAQVEDLLCGTPSCSEPRSGELRMQKLKSHLVRTQSLNVLPLWPGVDQFIATHATLTARDFFLAYFYTSGPFTCIFSKTSPDFSCVGCDQHMVPVQAHRIKQVTLPDAGSRVECPQNVNRPKKHDLWYDDLWKNNLEIVKFVFSPDVILCG